VGFFIILSDDELPSSGRQFQPIQSRPRDRNKKSAEALDLIG
jgi:hypothetical protein